MTGGKVKCNPRWMSRKKAGLFRNSNRTEWMKKEVVKDQVKVKTEL